jgi:hypothetical protein
MKSKFQIKGSCPVSKDSIDENKTRIIAFLVVVLTSMGIYYVNYYIICFLTVDFVIRAFSNGNASPVKFVAIGISKLFHIQVKPCNAAPKRFAAGLGMIFCFIITVLQLTHFITASQVVGILLIFCAILECAFGYCLGCNVYSFLMIFRIKNK